VARFASDGVGGAVEEAKSGASRTFWASATRAIEKKKNMYRVTNDIVKT